MPLLIHAVAAWLIGLYAATILAAGAGVHELIAAALVGCVCVVISLNSTSKMFRTICAWGALSSAAFVIGLMYAREASACQTKLLQQRNPIVVALDSRAVPGAFVRGQVSGVGALANCHTIATMKVRKGFAEPGNIAFFTGERLGTDHGLRLDGEIRAGPRRAVLRAWRGHAGEEIDSLFGPRASLARALLIADQDGIDVAIRDRFAEAGLIHILSISGLHVALIAGGLTVIAGAMRLPRDVAAFASLALVTLYVLALGAPPPAVRSAVMLGTSTLIARMQRPVHPWTALALGAVIPTWQPAVVLDLGWQLSVSGMASLVAARALMRRVRNSSPQLASPRASRFMQWRSRQARDAVKWMRTLDGWRWTLMRELVTGTIASLVTAPIVAWYFGRVSLVAPLSNIAAAPVIAFLQPALFLALVLAPWHALAKIAADACIVPLAALDQVALRASEIPHAAMHVAPTLLSAVCLGIATAAFVRGTAAKRPARYVIGASIALCIAVWSPILQKGNGELELHMIDVGQGDAIALRTPHGHWILIDAGRSWKGGDAGRRTVVPYVRRLGGDVAAFFLTHPHDDHVGGAASVISALHPQSWYEPAYVGTTPTYGAALRAIQGENIPWHRAHPGDSLRIDGVLLRMLAPDSAWTSAQQDPNLASVVIAVEFGRVRWLFTGDAEGAEEEWLIRKWGDQLQSSVLKSGHHGSKTSSTAAFLDAVNPRVALVSVGAGNTYGLPSPSVMESYRARGIQTLRTDEVGAIIVRTDGVKQQIVTAAGKWNVPTP
ncbi:MAG: DNA internalization-related competence protein ComEC/Rec2 [Gemmatimonadaceae bacterium]